MGILRDGVFIDETINQPTAPKITESSLQRIKQRFFAGEFTGEAGAAIVELIQIIDCKMVDKDVIDGLGKKLNELREAFPGPECEDCSCEMSLANHGNQAFYVCTCYEGGCTCFQGHAPCSWCMHIIPAEDWMLEHSSEHRIEKRAEENQRKHLAREDGPSAAAAAKPVTPRFVMSIQGDTWDGKENL